MAAPGSSSRCVVALCYRRTRYSSASGSAPLPAGSPAPPDLGSSSRSCASSSPGWSLHQACDRAARALERPAKWGSLSLRAAQCPVKKIVGTIEEAARPLRFDIKMKIYKVCWEFSCNLPRRFAAAASDAERAYPHADREGEGVYAWNSHPQELTTYQSSNGRSPDHVYHADLLFLKSATKSVSFLLCCG